MADATPPAPPQRKIIHVDMDAFYASRRYGVLKAQISAAVAHPAT